MLVADGSKVCISRGGFFALRSAVWFSMFPTISTASLGCVPSKLLEQMDFLLNGCRSIPLALGAGRGTRDKRFTESLLPSHVAASR